MFEMNKEKKREKIFLKHIRRVFYYYSLFVYMHSSCDMLDFFFRLQMKEMIVLPTFFHVKYTLEGGSLTIFFVSFHFLLLYAYPGIYYSKLTLS